MTDGMRWTRTGRALDVPIPRAISRLRFRITGLETCGARASAGALSRPRPHAGSTRSYLGPYSAFLQKYQSLHS